MGAICSRCTGSRASGSGRWWKSWREWTSRAGWRRWCGGSTGRGVWTGWVHDGWSCKAGVCTAVSTKGSAIGQHCRQAHGASGQDGRGGVGREAVDSLRREGAVFRGHGGGGRLARWWTRGSRRSGSSLARRATPRSPMPGTSQSGGGCGGIHGGLPATQGGRGEAALALICDSVDRVLPGGSAAAGQRGGVAAAPRRPSAVEQLPVSRQVTGAAAAAAERRGTGRGFKRLYGSSGSRRV